jgi:hypothetical protein
MRKAGIFETEFAKSKDTIVYTNFLPILNNEGHKLYQTMNQDTILLSKVKNNFGLLNSAP